MITMVMMMIIIIIIIIINHDHDDAHVDDVKVLLLPGLCVLKYDDDDEDDDDDGLYIMFMGWCRRGRHYPPPNPTQTREPSNPQNPAKTPWSFRRALYPKP